jgi:dethiobiotin synthetase
VSLFVTGTDTGVGKTHIAARILHLLRASGVRCAGMKPICCGDRRDAQALLAAGSDGVTIDEVNPVWFKTPAAPIVGTLVERVPVDVEQILSAFQSLQNRVEHVIVEGTGGWLVPIRSDYFVSDLAVAMKLPVVVVAQNRLGCLNHAVLTVRSVAIYQLRCVGLVLNNVATTSDVAALTNAEVLKRILNIPLLAGLGENLMQLPSDWRLALDLTKGNGVLI